MVSAYRQYLCDILIRSAIFFFVVLILIQPIDLLNSLVFSHFQSSDVRLGGYAIATKLAFEASLIAFILILFRKNVKILRGRYLPPYLENDPPLHTAASEYSLLKKKRAIKISFVISIFLSIISSSLSAYFAQNQGDLLQRITEIIYVDEISPLFYFIIPDVVANINAAPEEAIPILPLVIFSIWLPAIPLFVFFTNSMSYLYEILRAEVMYFILSRK